MISKLTEIQPAEIKLQPVDTNLQRTREIELQQTTEVELEKPSELLQKPKAPKQVTSSERMLLPSPPKPRWWMRLLYYAVVAAVGVGVYVYWPQIKDFTKPWVDKFLPSRSAGDTKKA